jgi:iron complex outermembrane receptor protein
VNKLLLRVTMSWRVRITCALLAAVASLAQAQQAPQSEAAPAIQEVVVTGSIIRRTDTETPSPVQVVTSQDLQQSGYTSVSEVLRNLSANGAGTLSQSFPNAFAGGATGVSLRGLTVGATLTLMDGNRMVPYPLSDDGQRSFVDVTAIPFNAVDRIEVLKDGASSEYGSDAIAGVINIILKKTYQGAEITAEDGISGHKDGNLVHFAGIFGTGDLAGDGYNAFLSFEYRRQDQILAQNRSGLWTDLDWSGYGGFNTTPGAGTNFAGTYPNSLTGYLINPNNPALSAAAFLPGCNYALLIANKCTYQLSQLQLQPNTSAFNMLGRISTKLGSSWEGDVTASWFNSQSQQMGNTYPSLESANGTPAFGLGGIFQIAAGPGRPPTLIPNPPQITTVPANYPGNPFGQPAALILNLAASGLGFTDYSTDTYRLVAEAAGPAAGWDVHFAAGASYALTVQTAFGAPSPALIQDSLNALTPINSLTWSQVAPPTSGSESSQITFANLKGSRPLFELPGGPLALGLGIEYYEKKLNATAPTAFADGSQIGNDAFAVGSQEDTAAFAELDALVLKGLELNAAVRYDHYNTYGSSTTPKFSFKWTPIQQLAFRGTWGKGFRAPNVAESGDSGAAFLINTIPDPVLCPNPNGPKGANSPGNFPSQCSVELLGFQISNPQLKPETSTNYTVGFIFEPIKQTSVSVDYYDIKINSDIISASEAGGFLNSTVGALPFVRGPQVSLPFVAANGSISNVLSPVGTILYQPVPYVNATQDETSGIDVDFQSVIDMEAAGKLTAELNYTHIIKFNLIAFGVTYELAGTHGPSGVGGDTGNPKDRAVFRLTWDKGPAEISANVNYIGSFTATDPSIGQNTCQEALTGFFSLDYGPRFPTGASGYPSSFCNVASFTDVDLYGQWTFNEHLSLHGSILNVFDKPPPLDMTSYGAGAGLAYDAAMHQIGAVGRFFTIGATYKF